MLRFSIITPNLNQGEFLQKNLISVSQQTYDSFEHIVIDGNSKDQSAEILKNYTHNKHFIYLCDSDAGQSDAINRGFQIATGDILAWLNADDFYSTDETISIVAKVFNENPDLDVVYGRGDYVDSSGTAKPAWIQENAENLNQTLSHSVGILQPALFFRRKLLKTVGYLDLKNEHSMDYDYWVRFALANSKFSFLDRNLASAQLHQDAKSIRAREAQLLETIEVCAKHFKFAHPRWITAYARSKVLGDTSFLKVLKDAPNESQLEEIESIERELFRAFNSGALAIDSMAKIDETLTDKCLARFGTNRAAATSVRTNKTITNGKTSDIALYPPFTEETELRDQLSRLSWYLPQQSGISIRIFLSENLRNRLLSSRTSYSIPGNVSLVQTPESRSQLVRLLQASRTIGIWHNYGKNAPVGAELEDVRVFNIDKHHENRREAFQYSVLLHELDWPHRQSLRKSIKSKTERLLRNDFNFNKAYLFCTGPSISDAFNHKYNDGYRIVCNSIVNNNSLMEAIQPHFIVAADPVFHFGSSEYSYAFREKLIEAAERYDCTILVPFFFYPLIANNCPRLLERTIGISQDSKSDYNFNLLNSETVRGAENILTLLMIPLGATLADELIVLGCDGRSPNETYFWKHDKSSQFDTLMTKAKEYHPGFFDHCDYADYYESHCANLECMISSLERTGKSLKSLTKSYIPCLTSRASIDI